MFRAGAAVTVTLVSKVATALASSACNVGTAAVAATAAAAAASGAAKDKSGFASHEHIPKQTRLRHGKGEKMKEV